jgi:hypothetical protein
MIVTKQSFTDWTKALKYGFSQGRISDWSVTVLRKGDAGRICYLHTHWHERGDFPPTVGAPHTAKWWDTGELAMLGFLDGTELNFFTREAGQELGLVAQRWAEEVGSDFERRAAADRRQYRIEIQRAAERPLADLAAEDRRRLEAIRLEHAVRRGDARQDHAGDFNCDRLLSWAGR